MYKGDSIENLVHTSGDNYISEEQASDMSTEDLWEAYSNNPSSTEIKSILINQYRDLVYYVIHYSKFPPLNTLEKQDLSGFGIEGLNQAIQRFDTDFGVKFETYAIQRIKGKIIDELRKTQIKPRPLLGEKSLYHNISLENKNLNIELPSSPIETLPNTNSLDPQKKTEQNEQNEALREAIVSLSNERDRLIITLYYFHHLNYREISEVLDITISRISQIHSRIIVTLKKKLGKMGFGGNKKSIHK